MPKSCSLCNGVTSSSGGILKWLKVNKRPKIAIRELCCSWCATPATCVPLWPGPLGQEFHNCQEEEGNSAPSQETTQPDCPYLWNDSLLPEVGVMRDRSLSINDTFNALTLLFFNIENNFKKKSVLQNCDF